MALNTMKYPISQMARRGLAAQAAVRQAENPPPPPEVNCTALPNKLLVNSLDLCGPLSRVSIAFRVGPRNETSRNLGAVHMIRLMAGFGTQKCSGFSIWKNIQHNGGHLFCTGDREITAFHLVAARHKIKDSLKFLSAVAVSPGFKPWEVKDNLVRVRYEIGGLSPQAKVMDKLHAVAFRTGLGNPLFIPEDQIGLHTPEMLHSFYLEGFTSNRATVTGYNMNHNDMIEFSKSLDLFANDPIEGNSKYFGGEIREQVNSYFAHIAVATEGVGSKNIKDALCYSLLQHALGASPVIKWGGSPSPLYKAVHPVAPDAGVCCLNASYSDSGLFGFFITSSAENAGKALVEAFKVIRSGSISEADFKRAKALLKMNVLFTSESSENIMEDMTNQSLLGGVIVPGPVLSAAVDKISLADVNNAAKKIAGGKFSLVGYGDLNEVPYLDELK